MKHHKPPPPPPPLTATISWFGTSGIGDVISLTFSHTTITQTETAHVPAATLAQEFAALINTTPALTGFTATVNGNVDTITLNGKPYSASLLTWTDQTNGGAGSTLYATIAQNGHLP